MTGQVRELLCKDCNIVLGLVEDSPEHLHKLIDYVLRHSPHNNSLSSELFEQKQHITSEPPTEKFQTICVAGAYERTNGRMVIDMFAPTIGVETIEDVSKETYDHIIKEIGSCQ